MQMDTSIFQADRPGQLVKSKAWEHFVDKKGLPSSRLADCWAFVPDPLPPVRLNTGRLIAVYGRAERVVGELGALARGIQYSQLLAAPLLRREARLSSKIENTIATAEEVIAYETGRPVERDDPIEVHNYLEALKDGLTSRLPLSMRLTCEMHRRLLKNVRGEDSHPGEVRRDQNRIGGRRDSASTARFIPPPPGEPLQRCLRDLELYWNRSDDDVPALIRIALAHYQFEAIHPFGDGNGRLGRAIIVLSMCRLGLIEEPLMYMSDYFSRNRQEYYDRLLRVSTHGEWHEWCEFFLVGVAEQAIASSDRVKQIEYARGEAIRALQAQNAPGKAIALVDTLIERPYTTASDIAASMSVKDPTARNYIARLESLGFLKEITGGNYGRVWAATPILAIINADEGTA
jgi:Fic family protein